MQRILINYADGQFYKAQRVNAYTGLKYAGLSHTINFRRQHLDPEFVQSHQALLNIKRGAGLWLWKPYLIRQALNQANLGDIVVYSDSSAVFLASIEPLISTCRESSSGILACDLGGLIERQYTKRDAFVLMGCDHPSYHNSAQLMTTLLVFVKNPRSELFVEQWLRYAVHPQLLTDNASVCGLPELSGFREHRHDQSIFSLLYKKWQLQSYQTLSGQDIDNIFQTTPKKPLFKSSLSAYIYLPKYWRCKSSQHKYYPPTQTQQDDGKLSHLYDPHLALLQAQKLLSDKQFSHANDVFDQLYKYLETTSLSETGKANDPEFLSRVYEHRAICYFRQQRFVEAERNYLLAAHYLPEKPEYKIKQQLCKTLSKQTQGNSVAQKPILILLYNGFPGEAPSCQGCPVRFEVTSDRRRQEQADIVLYHIPTLSKAITISLHPEQISVAASMESDVLYPLLADTEFMAQFDVTMTYQQSADVWCAYFSKDILAEITQPSRPKTAAVPVACFLSNTSRASYDRQAYLNELMDHIAVDSYGSTLPNQVLAEDNGRATKLDVCANYAFTLAFENSCSQDYVSEKFFDALASGSVPVYLGAPNIDEYAPADKSYINALDFSGPKELAQFLNQLYQDTEAYEQYLAWKHQPLRQAFLDKVKQQRLNGLCRLCIYLHKAKLL